MGSGAGVTVQWKAFIVTADAWRGVSLPRSNHYASVLCNGILVGQGAGGRKLAALKTNDRDFQIFLSESLRLELHPSHPTLAMLAEITPPLSLWGWQR